MQIRWKNGRAALAVAIVIGGIVTGSTVATPAGADAPTSGLSIVESTQATGYVSGQVVQLGFQVTNTGNTFIGTVAVTDTLLASVVCQQTTLAPGEVATCNGSHTATAADVTAQTVTDSATVTGVDTSGARVSAQTPTALTLATTPPATTPLLPTPLTSAAGVSTPDLMLTASGPCSTMNAVDAYQGPTGSGFGPIDTNPGPDKNEPIYDQWGNPKGPAKYNSYGNTPWVQAGYGCNATASLNGVASPAASSPTAHPGCNTNLMGVGCPGTAQSGNDWKLSGESSGGLTTCSLSSQQPTGTEPGPLCIGATFGVNGQAAPAVAIAVPTANVSMSIGCQFNSQLSSFTRSDGAGFGSNPLNANNSSSSDGAPLDGNVTLCAVQAITSTDGTNWSPLGQQLNLTSGSGINTGTLTIPLNAAEQYVALRYDYGLEDTLYPDPFPSGAGMLAASPALDVASQATGDAQALIGTNFCTEGRLGTNPNSGTADNACGVNPAVQQTFGPAAGVTPALLLAVEPTAEVQANAVVSRIVYQPPGAQSSQTYSEDMSNGVETDLSLGQSSSDVSGADTSLQNSISGSAALGDWASVNLTAGSGWEKNNTFTSSTSDTSGSGSVVSSDYTSSLGTPPRTSAGPDAPPWMNDQLLVQARPQFGVWDFAYCANGQGAVVSGTSTACPGGAAIKGTTGAAPLTDNGSYPLTVSQVVPCAEGQPFPIVELPGEPKMTQQECDSLLAQDPFAATALGLIPTPAGQEPGQALDPSTVFGNVDRISHFNIGNAPQPEAYTQQTVKSNTDTMTSTMETAVTSTETNSVAVAATGGVKFPLFSGGLSDTLTYTSSNTVGQTLDETYSGTSTFSSTQSFTASASLQDLTNTIQAESYWDPRFDSFMFQEGDTGSALPTVAAAATTKFTLSKGVSGAITSFPVSAIPVALTAGQQLDLPDGGQLATVAQPGAKAGAISIPLVPLTLTSQINVGQNVSLVGGVTVTGTGFDSGPAQVSFCETPSATAGSDCSTDTDPYTPPTAGGSTIYATAPLEPAGTKMYVEVQTESGAWSQPLEATAPSADGDIGSATPDLYTYTAPLQATTVQFTSTPPVLPVLGSTYTPAATASSGLPVAITLDGGSTGCSLNAGVVTFVADGSCVIDANQPGLGAYLPAPQVRETITVAKRPQTITFTTPAPEAEPGATYIPAATASSGLSVGITLDADSSGCTLLGGVVTFTEAGTCIIDASQAGDVNNAPAPQAQQQITIFGGTDPQSLKFVFLNGVPSGLIGTTYTPSVDASSGLTPVISLDGSSTGCSLGNGVVTFGAIGTCVIDANQAGSTQFAPAPQIQEQVVISGPKPQTIKFTGIVLTGASVGTSFEPEATATSGLPVAIALDGASLGCSLSNGVVVFTGPGTCIIDASQAGNAQFEAAARIHEDIPVVLNTSGLVRPLAVAADGTHVWVPDDAGSSLTQISASTGKVAKVLNSVKLGLYDSDAVASDKTHVWVVNGNDTVTEVTAATGAVVAVLQGTPFRFNAPDAIASDGTHVWVANGAGNSVTELSASNHKLVRVISGAADSLSKPDAIVSDGTHVWVASARNSLVTEFNAETGARIAVISKATGGFSNPDAIASHGTDVWVANAGNKSVTELNALTHQVIAKITASNDGFNDPDAVAADGTHVWIANGAGNSVTELNASSRSLVQVIKNPKAKFSDPAGIASDGTHVWVANGNGASVTELTASTGDPVRVISR